MAKSQSFLNFSINLSIAFNSADHFFKVSFPSLVSDVQILLFSHSAHLSSAAFGLLHFCPLQCCYTRV